MTDRIASKQPRRSRRRIAFSLSALAGVGYTAAWIISLSVGAPNPSVAAPGSQVVAAFAGRGGPALAQFALNEGVAAIALVAVVTSVAACRPPVRACPGRTGCRRLRDRRGRDLLGSSWPWAHGCSADWCRTGGPALPGPYTTRSPGWTGRRCSCWPRWLWPSPSWPGAHRILPRWLAPLGVLLAAALVISGLGYLLLAPGLASAVYVSGILLLIFVCATGIPCAAAAKTALSSAAGRRYPDGRRRPGRAALRSHARRRRRTTRSQGRSERHNRTRTR